MFLAGDGGLLADLFLSRAANLGEKEKTRSSFSFSATNGREGGGGKVAAPCISKGCVSINVGAAFLGILTAFVGAETCVLH